MHTLISGVTECGKTTLGKNLARLHQAQGFRVLVLTSVWEKWPADYQTTTQEDFLKNFWDSRECVAFIDEAGDTVGKYNKAMTQTATKGRHWGHQCYYLVQSPTLIDSNVRKQCSQLFCFAIAQNDADLLADEYLQPKLKQAPTLKQFEYYRALRFGRDGKPLIEMGRSAPGGQFQV